MIRIGIDMRTLSHSNKSGVGYYVQELAEYVPTVDSDIQYYFFTGRSFSRTIIKKYNAPNVHFIRLPFNSERLFMKTLMYVAPLFRLDLFHFPISIIPQSFPIRSIITIYDLTYEIYPEFYSPEELKLQKEEVKRSTRESVGIITISNATKLDLIKFYKLPDDKIQVIYPKLRTEITQRSKKFKRNNVPYFLAVGNIQPRKNFLRLVKAFAKLKQKNIHLIIVGNKQDQQEVMKLRTLIKQHRLINRVHIKGYVSDTHLTTLYNNAIALVFPSLYEGYGYPIIEAFANYCPVITSNTSSMAEIATDAALIVDPLSVGSIEQAMEKIHSIRTELIKKGINKLEELSKNDMAKQVVDAYKYYAGRCV